MLHRGVRMWLHPRTATLSGPGQSQVTHITLGALPLPSAQPGHLCWRRGSLKARAGSRVSRHLMTIFFVTMRVFFMIRVFVMRWRDTRLIITKTLIVSKTLIVAIILIVTKTHIIKSTLGRSHLSTNEENVSVAGRPRPPPRSTTASAYASSTACAALTSITHTASTVCRGVSSTAEYAAIYMPHLLYCSVYVAKPGLRDPNKKNNTNSLFRISRWIGETTCCTVMTACRPGFLSPVNTLSIVCF